MSPRPNWKTLTLPRTGGRATFLLRSKHPFFHYAAALISGNTKIQLNGAIFSFAFEGHFSCSENSCHSDGTRGLRCNNSLICEGPQAPGEHSLAVAHGPQLEFTLRRASSCASDRPTAKTRGGEVSDGLIDKGRKNSPVTALSVRSQLFARPTL